MTDNSQNVMTNNFNNLQEKNQQVLDNISQLQTQEKHLYDSLDNVNLSPEEKQQIIVKINELSQMRLNMYSTIKDMYSFYNNNIGSSATALDQSVTAINILENELNETKRRMNLLEDEKFNKMRLVGINTYYGKRYNAHSTLMKTIVFMCIPLIILAVLANNSILPPKIYVFLSGIILIIGLVIIGLQLIDMSNRSNMNWDEYNWYFDQTNAPTEDISTTTSSSSSDPWTTPTATCIGSACCYEGSVYDSVQNICVPNSISTSTST